MRIRSLALLVVLTALLLPLHAGGGDEKGALSTRTIADEFYGSSLLAWVDAVAAALEERAREGGATAVRLDVRGGRGIADRKAARVFQPRLAERLRERGRLVAAEGGLRVRVELSIDAGLIWAVGLLEGEELPGPAAFAVSWPMDRELEAVLATAPTRAGQARWSMERLGTVPAGVLDVALVDLDGDRADEIVLLSIDGVRTLRFAAGDARPEPLGGPWALPGDRDWPRVVAGWLARSGDRKVRIGTTAGHAGELDASAGRWSRGATGIPLEQPDDPGRDPILLARLEGSGPLLHLFDPNEALPELLRDAVRLPGLGPAWVWVGADGRLGGVKEDGGAVSLPEGRVGDRLLLADLDGDGLLELVTTDASDPMSPDHITVHRLGGRLDSHSVLFRSALDGGGAVALAAGDLDFDGRADLVVVEEGRGSEAVLWRVERSR